MELLKSNILQKINRRFFSSAYDEINENQFIIYLAQAFFRILRFQKDKSKLITAYTDINLYGLTEALSDIGFIWKDPLHTFFGGDVKDHLHPFNPIEDLKKYEFDVVLGHSGIDLVFFAESVKKALKEVKLCNFKTCLNIHKISIIAALICLLPNNSNIVEVGSYQCGTTIFMAQLCKILNKKIKIFACDTFEGMPSASDQDRKDPIFYDLKMFNDNPIEKVQKRINKQNLEDYINLVKGNVIYTLQEIELKDVSFVFIDTDQYKGTKAGLDFIKKLKSRPQVIIDDTELSSVSLAIDEFLNANDAYTRKNLVTNFDYLVPQKI